MSLNWLEIDRVLEELPLEGSFLQNIRQISFHTLIFEFHRPGRSFNMLVCLERSGLRLHEASRRSPSLPKPPRFTSYMRSRIKGARVIGAGQMGSDRIVRLVLRKGDREDRLYIRLWGGAANLILCDREDRILDAFSRRPARGEMPGERYAPELSSEPPKKTFTLRPLPEGLESYSLFLEDLYGRQEALGEREELVKQAGRALEYRENALLVRRRTLSERIEGYDREEIQREAADCLMACLSLIPKGAAGFRPEEGGMHWSGGETIPLDPKLSAVENAQAYYKKAGKAARGRELTREELDNIENRLRTLQRELASLEEMDEETLKALIPAETKAAEKGKASPGLSFRSGDFTILVGRSAKENEALLGRHVRGNDLWLHTRDYPGAYVFVRTPRGKTVPLETLLDAGNLALFYSKAKASGAADLYYTQVKYLRKPKNGKQGLVLPTREKNLFIKQDEKRIRRLKGETE